MASLKVGKLFHIAFAVAAALSFIFILSLTSCGTSSSQEEKMETQRSPIPFGELTENNPALAKGQSSIKTEGVMGYKEVTYKVTYKDGKEINRERVSEKISPPVTKVTFIGTYVPPTPTVTTPDISGSGHEAGYEWAAENDITEPSDCGGNSQSFIEGCEAYAEENAQENSNDYGDSSDWDSYSEDGY